MRLLHLALGGFLPEISGGAQISMDSLLHRLRDKGVESEVVAVSKRALERRKAALRLPSALAKIVERQRLHVDVGNSESYSVHVLSSAVAKSGTLLKTFAQERRYDAVTFELGVGAPLTLLAEILRALQQLPALGFVRSIDQKELGLIDSVVPRAHLICNSNFTKLTTAKFCKRQLEVIYPAIDLDLYKSRNYIGRYVTAVNLREEKGGHLLPKIAREMPDTQFLIRKGGWLGGGTEKTERELSTLSNVVLTEFAKDPSSAYASTKILLVPSQFEEPFGRVVLEAQCNGIPAVVSRRGGLTEAVGAGGVIVDDYQNPKAYVDSIRSILESDMKFSRLSAAALENSEKRAFALDAQVESLVGVLQRLVGSSNSNDKAE